MPGRPRPNRRPLTEGALFKGNYYNLATDMLGSRDAPKFLRASTSDLAVHYLLFP